MYQNSSFLPPFTLILPSECVQHSVFFVCPHRLSFTSGKTANPTEVIGKLLGSVSWGKFCQLRPAGTVLGRGGNLYEVTHRWSHALVATLGSLTIEPVFHNLMIAKIFNIISLIQHLNSVYFLIFWLFVKTVLKTLIRQNCAAESMSLVFALSKTMALTDGGLWVTGQSPYLLLIASNTPSYTKPPPMSGL